MDRKSWQSSWGQAPQSVSTHPVNSTGKWCEVSAQLLMVRQVHHALNNICIFHSFIWHLLINLLFLGTVNVIQCTGLTTEWSKTVLIKKVFQSTMCVRQISEHNVIRVLIKVWKNCSVTMRLEAAHSTYQEGSEMEWSESPKRSRVHQEDCGPRGRTGKGMRRMKGAGLPRWQNG